MSLSTVNSLDLFIIALVLILALKGVFNGFLRELINLIAIVGGVVVASRAAVPLAHWTEATLFHLKNPAVMELLAFLLVLLLVWGGITLLGRWVEARDSEVPSPLNRTFGYLLAALKYFLIFSIIVSALFRTTLIREKFASQSRSSLLYPVLAKTGAILIKLPAPVQGATKIEAAQPSSPATDTPAR